MLKMIKQQQNTQKAEMKDTVMKIENELKNDVVEKEKMLTDYENTMKRLQADFENYVKRSQKEKDDFAKVAVAKVLVKFVDIVDDLDRTLNILEKTQDGELKTGIKMVHSRFHKLLAEEGIKSFESRGKKLDPFQHEVIEMVSHNGPEGIVVEELQKGYSMKDKILRAAKVKVSKGKEVVK